MSLTNKSLLCSDSLEYNELSILNIDKGWFIIKQLSLFSDDPVTASNDYLSMMYETDSVTSSAARVNLERKYQSVLQPTNRFNRQLVSYQANKSAKMHRWFKYKEGFSARLVHKLIQEFDLKHRQHVLDPFAGVSTTLLVAQEFGLHATGIEVMPIGEVVWQAKSRAWQYDVSSLQAAREWVKSTPPQKSERAFPHVPITCHAFDAEQEAHLMWYDEQFQARSVENNVQVLLKFVLLSALEDISYTSKDGQYLRWDSRAEKVQQRNAKRIAQGKKPSKAFHKGEVLDVRSVIIEALDLIILDVSMMNRPSICGEQKLILGTALDVLPMQPDNHFDAVITSPPYCNRYDYTRTYALELAFLGLGHQAFLDLRQTLLSCTVENKSKIQQLRTLYSQMGRLDDFTKIINMLENHEAFQEILGALRLRNKRGEVNNKGIISMVEGYFTELAFVTYELFRVCKAGASVAIVNDNVRYSGEIIPVDLLMTDIAVEFGFTPETIYVLSQRKGNSSQQMGKYGREALRKSILIWKKQ